MEDTTFKPTKEVVHPTESNEVKTTVVDVAFDPAYVANGFDFPVGKPDAKGYVKEKSFGQENFLGEQWNGEKGGNKHFGDSVYSIGHGFVVLAEDLGGEWGRVIRIVHNLPTGELIESLYAHCDSILVEQGEYVKRGDKIATMGNASGKVPTQLYLEIRTTIDLPIGNGVGEDTKGYANPTEFIENNRSYQ